MTAYINRLFVTPFLFLTGAALASTANSDLKVHQTFRVHKPAKTLQPASTFPKVGASNKDLQTAIIRLQDRVEKLQSVAIAQHKAEIAKERKGISGDWADRLIFSGSLQTQLASSDRTDEGSFQQGNSYKLKINNINLSAHARLLSYMNAIVSLDSQPGAVNIDGTTDNGIEFEQAYMHFGDSQKHPYLLNVGRKYLPFGVYKHHPVISTVTQTLDEYIKTTLEVGANFHPLYASAYLFDAQGNVKGSGSRTLGNGGFEVGLYKSDPAFGYDFSIGWINNMAEAKSIYAKVRSNYHNVANYALHGALNYEGWSLVTDFSLPTSRFDSRSVMFDDKGAKPAAFASEISYNFLTNMHPSTAAIGYQVTREALVFGLPKSRLTTSYTYYYNHYLDIVLEYVRDHDYGSTDTAGYRQNRADGTRTDSSGTGRINNTAVVQLALNF